MAPRRYGVAPDGSVQRLWNGKLVEDFIEADTLRFMADTATWKRICGHTGRNRVVGLLPRGRGGTAPARKGGNDNE